MVIDIHPPRMARWKKPIRKISRSLRKSKIIPEKSISTRTPSWLKKPAGCFWGLCLSIIPGLAHLIQGRFREIRWIFLGWLLSLLIGLFFYGSFIGLFLLGLAIGLHVWIAVQHKLIKVVTGFGTKIISSVLVLVALILIYRAVPRLLIPGFSGAYTTLNIPYHNIKSGDFLLARNSQILENQIPRGSLVLIRLATIRVGRRFISSPSSNAMIVQVIGLPGEQIEIEDDAFIANGQRLDTDKYPVPRWLQGRMFSVIIKDDSYFISSEYDVQAQGNRQVSEAIRNTCVVPKSDIEGIAFMRWLPVSRRGFIREIE